MVSRRKFIGTAATATTGITILPSKVISGFGYKAPSDRLNIAGIGVGGKGYTNLINMQPENIVALCDVDSENLSAAQKKYPKAKAFPNRKRKMKR